MAMSTGVSIRWSPHSTADNQTFLKINTEGHELSLYKIVQENGKGTQCKLVSKHPKVPHIRCFDWSPGQEDLISVGQSSGEAFLVKLSNNTLIPLPVKPQRSCNSVSFNCTGKLLATALDKVRNDFCLNVWDVNQRLSSSGQGIVRPTYRLASNETIHSISFFREHPDVLVCGLNNKSIKCYDLRDSPNNPVFLAPSRCCYGISLDLDPNYFASYSEDGLISVWDQRSLRSANPTTSDNAHALLFNRPGGQISSLRYSNTKAGTFAVLNTTGGLRIYETGKISDAEPQLTPSPSIFPPGIPASGVPEFNKSRRGWRESASSLLDGSRINGGSSGSRTPNPRQEPGETLFVTRINDIVPSRSARNDRRIVSFDWMCPGDPVHGDLRTICLRADGTPDIVTCSSNATSLAFGSRNGLLITKGKDLHIIPSPPTTLQLKLPDPIAGTPKLDSFPDTDSPVGSPSVRLGMHEGRRTARSNSVVHPEDFLYDARDILRNDMCVVMRRRVEGGYEMDCAKNTTLVQEQYLKDLWTWLAGATEAAANNGMVAGLVDMSYMGVLGIWNSGTGLGQSHESVARRLTHGRGPKPEDWTAAISEINRKAGREGFKGRTDHTEQRRLALAICGWDFSGTELENELLRLEKKGEFAKAAGWALFHGEFARCIRTLSRGGQQMKVMSTAVAGYYSHAQMALSSPPSGDTATETAKNANIWKDLCREMAVELDEPYLRAVFAYVSNGEWRDVLDDVGLPIRERLLIALRWLGDDELTEYLEELTAQVIEDGDVDGIVLTGIGARAMDLLQVYVNRKGDVQTASLVASFAVPRYFEDERVGYWVESYRQLLNSWRHFHARAKFDVARGKYSRNRNGTVTINEVQRQVYVRCTYCDRNISHGATHSTATKPSGSKPNMNPREKAPTSNVPVGANAPTKATVCPQCKKSLPRCAVCLLNLGTKYYKKSLEGAQGGKNLDDGKSTEPENDYDRWFNFCLSCNHGMHSGHAREWFAKHRVCPVPDCDCRCKM